MIHLQDVRRLHIEPSSFCNAACPNCSRNHFGGSTVPWLKQKNLSLKDFQKFFPKKLIQNLELIIFCGSYGDPSLCEDLLEICSWLYSINKKLSIQLNTNGGTRNAEFWEKLAKLMNSHSRVVFSIDGLEDTNHIYRRNVSWEKVMTAVKSFIGAGGIAEWDFLVFAHNHHQIEEARALSKKLGFHEFYPKKAMGFMNQGKATVMPALKKDSTLDYFIFPPADDAFKSKELIDQTFVTDFKPWNVSIHDFIEDPSRNLPSLRLDENHRQRMNGCKINCLSKKNKELYVSAEGELYPCCFIGSLMLSSNRDHFTGGQIRSFMHQSGKEAISLHHHSMEEILNSELFQTKLAESWQAADVRGGKLAICSEICGENFHNYVDKKTL